MNNTTIYHKALRSVFADGEEREDRTGTGTYSLFGLSSTYNIRHSFPLLTTKKVFVKGMLDEFFWMWRDGSTNALELPERTQSWWTPWADDKGELGPIYGAQIRNYGGQVDQLEGVIKSINENPMSRRHVVTTWNPKDLPDMALPPCHGLVVQFYASKQKGLLSCQIYQRSGDMFLGVPINIASYSLLTCVIAQLTGYKPGHLTHVIGDAHVYLNHLDQVKEQLERSPTKYSEATLELEEFSSFDELTHDHINIQGYKSYPSIKAPLAV